MAQRYQDFRERNGYNNEGGGRGGRGGGMATTLHVYFLIVEREFFLRHFGIMLAPQNNNGLVITLG